MNLADIIALAKQGYTPKDIKELVALGESASDEMPPGEDHHEEDKLDEANDQKDDATQEAEQALDYKKLYEESQHKVNELTEKLEASQKKNIKQNMQDGDSGSGDQERINDLVRSFM